jgi:hypothetical protein
MHLVEDLLGRHNFTLSSVRLDPPSLTYGADGLETAGRMAALLNRNCRVRAVHAVLEKFGYHVPNPAMWPRMLQKISAFPKLIYRYVRRGNVEAFAELMLKAVSSGRKRSRGQP